MLLSDLCASLSQQSEWPTLASTKYGMRVAEQKNEMYQVPEIYEVNSSSPMTPALVLITAPAAVGKSTAADYMSHVLRAPILDLSTLQVGTGTLEGALSKSLGFAASARFQAAMMDGRSVLLIDALDEAEVRSGQANFQAFIRGLADTAADIVHGPAIILMSRAESARPLQQIFEKQRVSYSSYEIKAFDKSQAEQYLSKRMADLYKNSSREAVHAKHVRPFEEARETLFRTLASAFGVSPNDVWGNSDVRDFLGYAPVLDVAAEYLAVDNFTTLTKSLRENTDAGLTHWDLVATVINDLLLREQDKFCSQFKESGSFKRHGSTALLKNLYSPAEQCARLLDHVEYLALDLDIPASMPSELRDAYSVAVSAQLGNHPFLRDTSWFNVIFRDYVIAQSLVSPMTSQASAASIRQKLLSSAWKHSPMYGFFSYSLGKTDQADIAHCHSEELGAIYESLRSMCDSGNDLLSSVTQVGNHLVARFAVMKANDTAFASGIFTYHTHDGTKSVSFPRGLSKAVITNVPDVTLGSDHLSFTFGSQVYISCRDLLIAAKEVQVYVGADEDAVVIDAKSMLSEVSKVQADEQSLVILSEDLPYPWSKYHKNFDWEEFQTDTIEARTLFLEFRRIILRFKNAKDGELAVYQPMMDNLVVGENRRARTVLDFLQSIGCVKLHRNMYLLDLNAFARLGLSRAQLRDLNKSTAIGELSVQLLQFYKNSH